MDPGRDVSSMNDVRKQTGEGAGARSTHTAFRYVAQARKQIVSSSLQQVTV